MSTVAPVGAIAAPRTSPHSKPLPQVSVCTTTSQTHALPHVLLWHACTRRHGSATPPPSRLPATRAPWRPGAPEARQELRRGGLHRRSAPNGMHRSGDIDLSLSCRPTVADQTPHVSDCTICQLPTFALELAAARTLSVRTCFPHSHMAKGLRLCCSFRPSSELRGSPVSTVQSPPGTASRALVAAVVCARWAALAVVSL